MANIKSMIGNNKARNDSVQAPSGRSWTISDDSDLSSVINYDNQPVVNKQTQNRKQINPAEVAHMRQMAQERTQQINNEYNTNSLRRVELITGIGRKYKNVTIEGNPSVTFTLRSLKSIEQNYYSQVIENADRVLLSNGESTYKPTSTFLIKLEALSHSLHMIDNQPIDIVLGVVGTSYDEQLNAKKELLSEMDSALLDYLFTKFGELNKEVYDGYMPKNEEDVKEVAEAINKSS